MFLDEFYKTMFEMNKYLKKCYIFNWYKRLGMNIELLSFLNQNDDDNPAVPLKLKWEKKIQ